MSDILEHLKSISPPPVRKTQDLQWLFVELIRANVSVATAKAWIDLWRSQAS